LVKENLTYWAETKWETYKRIASVI
jgi:hypothetical protein